MHKTLSRVLWILAGILLLVAGKNTMQKLVGGYPADPVFRQK